MMRIATTSCFTPLEIQREVLANYLVSLCAMRNVSQTFAERVIAGVNTLNASVFDRLQRDTLERFPAASRYNSYLDVSHHVAKAMKLYLSFIEKSKKNRNIVAFETKHHRRMLDIGSGSGAFAFICNVLGHEVTGLDFPQNPDNIHSLDLNYQMARWYGVRVIEHRIEPRSALPIEDGSYDDFAIFAPTFYRDWQETDWGFLFADLRRGASGDASTLYLRVSTEKKRKGKGPEVLFSHDGAIARQKYHQLDERSYFLQLT
jgi:hypothetical protein